MTAYLGYNRILDLIICTVFCILLGIALAVYIRRFGNADTGVNKH